MEPILHIPILVQLVILSAIHVMSQALIAPRVTPHGFTPISIPQRVSGIVLRTTVFLTRLAFLLVVIVLVQHAYHHLLNALRVLKAITC